MGPETKLQESLSLEPAKPRALGVRIAAAGLLSALVLAATSYVINVVWLGPAHEALHIFRPDDDPRRMPGLMISSLVWGCLLAGGYRVFWQRAPRHARWVEGCSYGLLVCLFFQIIHSVFLYQFIPITADLLLGDVVHYLLSSAAAGGLIGLLVPPHGVPSGS